MELSLERDSSQLTKKGVAWRVEFRDDSSFGHDKARTIIPYAAYRDNIKGGVKPLLLYAGDGVSDFSAAKETELLFAKEGQGQSVPHLSPHYEAYTISLLRLQKTW